MTTDFDDERQRILQRMGELSRKFVGSHDKPESLMLPGLSEQESQEYAELSERLEALDSAEKRD